jgi:SAM-dependent methyltransferase
VACSITGEQQSMPNNFDPAAARLGGYLELDGTVEFYGRVTSILRPEHTVLDIGAGRGAWFHDDTCAYRKSVRDIRSKVSRLIGADIDPAVLSNPATSENVLIIGGRLPLPDNCVDVIVGDYVLEHIEDPRAFCAEIDRLLRPNGYFCARTPHKYCYVSIAARLIRNSRHSRVLSAVQPDRKAEDVFPTAYRLNTLRSIRAHFAGFENFSYLYATAPQYFWGKRSIYRMFLLLHRILPTVLTANIFIFLRKRAR